MGDPLGTAGSVAPYAPYAIPDSPGDPGQELNGGIDPRTGLPWNVVHDANSPSGYSYFGQPVTKEGAIYEYIPKPPSGGGGSLSPTNVYITQNPGQLNEDIVSDGNDGFPAGTVYQRNQLTGAITVKYRPSAVVDPRDRNGDGIDDSTGYALGVFKDTSGTSPSGYYYDPGNGSLVPVTPTGAPYSGPDLFPDKAGSAQVVGSAGGGYYERQKNGTWKLVIPGTSGSGSSGGGGGTYSGGGGGGGRAGGGLTGGGTNTTVHAGGFNDTRTTFNTSDIGPNSLANSEAERAQRASEFAATYGLNRSREQRDAAATYAQLLSQVDPNAYAAFLQANGGGRLDNALLSGGNALSRNALRPAALALEALQGGPGGGLTGLATAGGDATSAAAGAGGGGIPTAGAPGTPAAAIARGPLTSAEIKARQGIIEFATPEDYAKYRAGTDQTPEELAYNQLHAGEQGAIWGGDYGGRTDLSKYYGLANGVLSGRTAGTQTIDPYGAGYAGAGKGVIGTAAVLPPDQQLSAPVDNLAQPPNTVPVYDNQFSQPYPDLGKNPDGTAVSPVQLAKAPHWDPTTNQWVPTLAHGGLTRARQMIVGDPQADGRPNPEVIMNPTNAPIRVMPMRGMGGLTGMRHMMPDGTMMAGPPMGPGGGLTRMPRFAYGSFATYEDWIDAQNAGATTTSTAPATTTPTTTAPVAATAPAPTTTTTPTSTATAPAYTATATATPPSQIGAYSTAPGSAGQPVAAATPTGTVDAPSTFYQTTATNTGPNTKFGAYDGSSPGTIPPNPDKFGITAPAAPTTAAVPTPSYSAPATQTGPVATAEPSQASFDQVEYIRRSATNPWMADPTAFMNVDYLSRDPVDRRLYEQWLVLNKGVPQESIDFHIAKNRLAGASLAAMSQGR